MVFGVVSDTHDNVSAVQAIATAFEQRGVERVVHCGDVIAPPVLPFFDGFEVHGVLGNNDGELDGLEAGFRQLGNGSRLHGRFAELRIEGVDLAVRHGEDLDDVEALATTGAYDLVCYGHHHERDLRDVDGTTVLNPGAHFPTVPSEHRTIALVDPDGDDLDVEFVEIA
jgi:hypothetical protein